MSRIIALLLVLSVAVFASPLASAVVIEETETVGVTVTLTGTPYVDVVTNDAGDVTWSGVNLGATTWKASDNYLEVTYLLPAGGGISINTQNAGDEAGLIGADDGNSLPMSWRAFTSAPTSFDIYSHTYSEPDDGVDYNGDGDQDDYIVKITEEAVKPAWVDVYACWVWMLDGPVDQMADATTVTYSSPVTTDGIQHAEMTFDTWGGSPDYVLLGADFSQGTPQAYSSNLVVELYSE